MNENQKHESELLEEWLKSEGYSISAQTLFWNNRPYALELAKAYAQKQNSYDNNWGWTQNV